MIDEAAASELDALRVKYKAMVEENNALSIKVTCTFNDEADLWGPFDTNIY